ncbi:MAG: patatin-like phospholipase family protein [Spirochaetia bacterium]
MSSKWALVLSGGGGNGIAHVGALKAFEKMGYIPDLIVGTSIGAIIGSTYASGKAVSSMEDFLVNEFSLANYLEGLTFKLSGGPLVRYLQAQEAVNTLLINPGMDSGKRVLKLLKALTHNADFEDLDIPFVCNATDLRTGKEVVLDSGNVAESVRASLCFPGLFHPVEKDGMLLVDGTVVNNLPVSVAHKRGFKKVIAIDVAPFQFGREIEVTNGLTVFFRAFTIASELAGLNIREQASLRIETWDGNNSFDFTNIQGLIDLGERTVQTHENKIRRLLEPGVKKLKYIFPKLSFLK